MKLVNQHHRDFTCTSQFIAQKLDSLGSDNDALWPHQQWPAMKFDKTPQLGAVGGHGLIPYHISIYQPPQQIRFQFDRLPGIQGYHEFVLTEVSPNRCRLSHDLRAELSFKGVRNWYLMIAPLHDALIEDLLDQLESEISGTAVQQKWSLRVRLIRRLFFANKTSANANQVGA